MPVTKAKPEPVFPDVAAWPGESPASAPAGIGHNKPPLEEQIPAEFRAALLEDRPDFLTRFADLVEAADRAEATDDDTLARCGNLVNAYRKAISHIDATHRAVKQPYLDGGRLCDAEKNALRSVVDEAKAKVERIGNTYVAKREAEAKAERDRLLAEQRAAAERAAAAERERIRAEQEAARAVAEATNKADRDAAIERAAEAAREAEEAQAAAALETAIPAKSDPVRSDEGAVVSGKQEWECAVEDYTKAFHVVKTDPKVKEAIDAAVKRQVRAGQRELKGVKIWPVSKASFR